MEEGLKRNRKKKVKINWGRFIAVLAIGFLALGLVIGTAGFVYLKQFQGNGDWGFLDQINENNIKTKDRINFLIMGTDIGTLGDKSPNNRTRSDTIMVASVNTKLGIVNIISIPRDTRVTIPGRSHPDKITHAHAYGGAELSVATVEDFLGVEIDHYIEIDYEGFVKLVDIIGGVPMNVPKRLYYVDPVQDLVINIPKGEQVLDGKQALGFVRFRHDALGDIGRIERQQEFIKAVFKKVLSPNTLAKLPEISRELPKYVVTDMTPREMIALASHFTDFKNGKIVTKMIPGTDPRINGISYWVPDMEATRKLVEEMTSDSPVSVQASTEKDIHDIKIRVLNGSGVSGIAKKVAERLKAKGYNVVETGNADNFNYSNCQVISYGEKEYAHLIGKLLTDAEIIEGEHGKDDIDITVIVGKNYQ